MNYRADPVEAHLGLSLAIEHTNLFWLIRFVHSNGASLYFVALYLHLGRGLYYNSFVIKHTWILGVTIFLLSIITAFIGYVLPFSQISF